MKMMNYEHRKAIEQLRKDGYAIAFIAPEDLKGTLPEQVEEWMYDCADECIRITEREKNLEVE